MDERIRNKKVQYLEDMIEDLRLKSSELKDLQSDMLIRLYELSHDRFRVQTSIEEDFMFAILDSETGEIILDENDKPLVFSSFGDAIKKAEELEVKAKAEETEIDKAPEVAFDEDNIDEAFIEEEARKEV
ncbi:MAG: hypothetical protein K5851_03615 [Lachnospiraceae bacterium]|nr:hypothetical protein [Lachnospiraceae bacterium]